MPQKVCLRYKLGMINFIKNEKDLAIEYYKKAIEIQPTHVEANNNLSLLEEVEETSF